MEENRRRKSNQEKVSRILRKIAIVDTKNSQHLLHHLLLSQIQRK